MKLRYQDNIHGYWLDGKRCKSVTTVAKIPEDLYRLQQWEKRQVAVGLAQRPDLLEAVAAHVDDNDVLNGLCDQAKEAAGANRGSRRGTAAHRVTERHDAGEEVIATPLAESILAGWNEVLDSVGLEIIPELMERIVVFPNLHICGKFDRIARTKKGKLVILDIKSGASAIDFPHSTAVQMAIYANAPLMAGPLNGRGETEKFEALPELDKKFGVLVHLPEDGPARAVKIDIERGWETARNICFPTITWRQTRKEMLVSPILEQAPIVAPKEPEEGRDADPLAIDILRQRVRQLDKAQASWLADRVREASESGHSIHLGERPSLRRFELARGLYALAKHEKEDMLAWALTGVLRVEPQAFIPLGAYVGSLGVDEATSFAHQIDRLVLEDGTADATQVA